MKLIEFINRFISGPFRICQMHRGASTLSIIYPSVDLLPDGIADKLIVSHIVAGVSQVEGPIIHIWCYDREELLNGQSSI
jgi:hypothetical protein